MATLLTSGTLWSFTLWALLFIIGFYFVTYYFVYLRQIKRWKQSNIPLLQPTFLVGHKHFLSLTKYCVTVPMDKIYNENHGKDLIAFFAGTMPLIMLRDQNLIRQLLIKNSSRTFATGFAMPESEVEAQYMVNLTVNEERWKFVRDSMTPIFLLSWFQGPRFEKIKETISDLLQSAEKLESEGSPFNIGQATKTAILNVGSSNFGIENHSQAMKDGLRSIVDDFFQGSYRRQISFHSLSYLPSLQKFEWFRVLTHKSINTMSGILQHLIEQRDQSNTETGDVVDILRTLRIKGESNNSWKNDSTSLSFSQGLTLRQMTGICLGITIGGTEAVHEMIDYAVHSLSLYPEYQRKIRREVHEALQNHGVSELNFDVVRNLSFTFQCLFEASRLFPLGAIIMRQCLEDIEIPGTDYIFRKGDRLILPLYSLSRDEVNFRDARAFDPERFASKDGNLTFPASVLSFGAGPRKCPGYKHGVFVGAAILASLIYKYEIKPRSHLKLMEATDFYPKGISNVPGRAILVDLVRWENMDDGQCRNP